MLTRESWEPKERRDKITTEHVYVTEGTFSIQNLQMDHYLFSRDGGKYPYIVPTGLHLV